VYSSFLSVLKYLLLLVVGIGFLYLAFREQDTEKLVADLLRANYWWVIASCTACLLSHFFRALRWNMLIKPLDHTPRISNTFASVMVGYLANQALPRLGEVSKCASLSKVEHIPVNQLIGTVVIERLCDTIMLVIVTALCLLLQYHYIADFIFGLVTQLVGSPGRTLYIIAAVAGVVMIVILWLLIKKEFVKFPKKIHNLFIFHSVMIWVLYYLSTYLCFFSLGATSELGLGAALATLFFGSIGMTIPVQGGIGTYHYMVVQGLTAYSISKSDGLAYATIIHSSQVLVILAFGALSIFFLMFVSSKQLKKAHAKNRTSQTQNS
jgi:uncharacterized membrane protein YbhN (UPF0104 family)